MKPLDGLVVLMAKLYKTTDGGFNWVFARIQIPLNFLAKFSLLIQVLAGLVERNELLQQPMEEIVGMNILLRIQPIFTILNL